MLEQGMMGGKEVGWDALRERLGLRGVVGKEWCDGDGEEWCDEGDGEGWCDGDGEEWCDVGDGED